MINSDREGENSAPDQGPSQLKKLGVLGAMGFEFVGFIVGGALIGRWIDARFSTAPWGVIGMILLGMLAAFWHIYRVVTRYLK